MTVPYRGFTLALPAAAVIAAAAACSGSPDQGQGTAAPSSPASASSGSPVAPAVPVPAGWSATPLAVSAGDGGGVLSRPHTLTVPAGWAARVWARVPHARMEAWTPGGDLLVSDPDGGKIMEQRAVIMAVSPGGTDLRVAERGVRNGEGLAVAPDGTVWTAVNERDNIPYPSHSPYGTYSDAFGQVIQGYVNNHPPDEVVPVTAARDLGWPYCDPDQDDSDPAGSLAGVPLVPNAATNPGQNELDCAALAPVEVGLPAHSAPLGMTFLEGSKIPARWSGAP